MMGMHSRGYGNGIPSAQPKEGSTTKLSPQQVFWQKQDAILQFIKNIVLAAIDARLEVREKKTNSPGVLSSHSKKKDDLLGLKQMIQICSTLSDIDAVFCLHHDGCNDLTKAIKNPEKGLGLSCEFAEAWNQLDESILPSSFTAHKKGRTHTMCKVVSKAVTTGCFYDQDPSRKEHGRFQSWQLVIAPNSYFFALLLLCEIYECQEAKAELSLSTARTVADVKGIVKRVGMVQSSEGTKQGDAFIQAAHALIKQVKDQAKTVEVLLKNKDLKDDAKIRKLRVIEKSLFDTISQFVKIYPDTELAQLFENIAKNYLNLAEQKTKKFDGSMMGNFGSNLPRVKNR